MPNLMDHTFDYLIGDDIRHTHDEVITNQTNITTLSAVSSPWELSGSIITPQLSSNTVNIASTIESTTKDTGALVVEGGVGVEKNLNVGGDTTLSGSVTLDSLADQAVLASQPTGGTDLAIATTKYADNNNLLSVTTQLSAYTVTSDDDVVICNAISGDFPVHLITAVGNEGKVFNIKSKYNSTDTPTVSGNLTETIDGDLSFDLAANECITIVSDNSNWHMI